MGVLHDPGVGKTPPLGVFAYYVWKEFQQKTVCVQPSSLMKKNRNEFLRFATGFSPEDVIVIDGGTGDGTTENGSPSKKMEQMMSDAKVFIMTAEYWRRHWAKMYEKHPDIGLFIGDEWHLLYSGNDSDRTQNLYQFCSLNRKCRVIASTGSLIRGKLSSAYPLIHLIEPRYYGNFGAFLNHHAERDEYGTVIYWKNHERIAQILGKHAIRRTFAEEYGPEAKILFYEPTDMKPKMREAYDEFHERAFLELDKTILDGSQPGPAAVRARQISSHPETFGLCKGEVSGKDERLILHLEDMKQIDNPGFVVFSSLIPEVERLYETVKSHGFKVDFMHGKKSGAKRAKIDEDYQAGRLDAIVATVGTAGVGFNWHRSTDFFFQSLNYDDTDFMQAIRRGIRGVRDHPLKLWVPSYINSIDQRIEYIIERKSTDANKVDPSKELIRFRPPEAEGNTDFEQGDKNFLLEY